MKKFGILIVILIIGATVGAAVALSYYQGAIKEPAGESTDEILFEVKSGQSTEVIAQNLKDKGLIKDVNIFVLYGKLNANLASGIQAGYFDIAPSDTIEEIYTILQKSRNLDDVKVSIPEGLRYDEIADIFAAEFGKVEGSKFSKDEFISIVEDPDAQTFTTGVSSYLSKYKPQGANLEGYLYPDTYFFTKTASSKDAVEKLLLTLFEQRLTEDDYKDLEKSNYSFYEILNIAAMIEREAFADDEKPMIADVIIKRLEKGVDGVKLLQIDATLLYIVKDWKANAFTLKNSDSPYNTYKFAGLPPTPIANPGISAIRGVLDPDKNDYYYYIHDNDGKIHYAKTLSEHNANVQKYL